MYHYRKYSQQCVWNDRAPTRILQWGIETIMNLMVEQSTLLLPLKKALRNGAQPLRVGVVLDRNRPSPWVDALLTFLRQIPGIEVHSLAAVTQGPSQLK